MLTRRAFHSSMLLALLASTPLAFAAGSASKRVASSADKAKPMGVGKVLPDVTVTNVAGESVKLKEALEGHPHAIVFYRGHWCPFCMKHLTQLQEIVPQLEEMGIKLVGITPDKPEYVAEAKEKGSLSFDIYSDSKLVAAKAMGVAFQLDPETAERYKKHLVESTGLDTGQLPVPAVFLTNGLGEITYVFSKPDYKVRLTNEELLAAVKKVQG